MSWKQRSRDIPEPGKVIDQLMRNQLLQLKESFWYIVLVFFTSILATLLFWGVLPTQFRINDNSDYISFYKPVAPQHSGRTRARNPR